MSATPIVLLKMREGNVVRVPVTLFKDTAPIIRWESQGMRSYYGEFEDGGRVEVFLAKMDETSRTVEAFTITIRSLSPRLTDYIFNLAVNGNLLIFLTDPFQTVLIDPGQEKELDADWREKYDDVPVHCTSAAELEPLLADQFYAWLAYRNRVIQD